ncbi:PQQ-like beta-propeller repeat protein [Nocardia sp. CDC159]|uniref:PQQ-like beta-propeller repeat protein n=1 Tax=Nocardia pulmonis TaxID=2951408 RepID=A0A9X2J085_9NOCA|nr:MULTISPECIES: PQQ-binding-like beta-propeller repeat protein [Nocardia]MCM6775691.1 PQQ-like beta-propeller repeat protein [Nocardia pulmonis]MCM6788333.1 PQQ-like beta-propeller repeat protein [Nocardia sp. CDC159]
MLAPERRTRADIYAAAAIAVLVVIAVVVVWSISDARGTVSEPAAHPPAPVRPADQLPTALRELWHVPDGAARRALAEGAVAVTGDDGTVTGRDPVTGEQVWKYRRDMPLCGVESQNGAVIATYRDQRGCSQTTLLSADTGMRRSARSSYMDRQVELSVDGSNAVARGPKRMEVWRYDLVRTLEYGYVDAPMNVRTQPRRGCALLSAASNPSRVAVLERCPDEAADRLTVMNPSPKENSIPEEYGSHVLTEPGAVSDRARVLAVTDNRIALYLPGNASALPELAIYDQAANFVGAHRLTAPMSEATTVTRLGTTFFVFTGNSLIALNASTLDPVWTASDALGGPAMMAGQLLMPVPDGVAVLDPATGAQLARIPLRRTDYQRQPISLAVVGSTLLELRGGQLYGLGG